MSTGHLYFGILNLASPPTIGSISPDYGPTEGDIPLTITGTGFQDAATVTFNSTPATDVTVESSTVITCTLPAHIAGGVNITVTNPDGQTGTLTGGFTFKTIEQENPQPQTPHGTQNIVTLFDDQVNPAISSLKILNFIHVCIVVKTTGNLDILVSNDNLGWVTRQTFTADGYLALRGYAWIRAYHKFGTSSVTVAMNNKRLWVDDYLEDYPLRKYYNYREIFLH